MCIDTSVISVSLIWFLKHHCVLALTNFFFQMLFCFVLQALHILDAKPSIPFWNERKGQFFQFSVWCLLSSAPFLVDDIYTWQYACSNNLISINSANMPAAFIYYTLQVNEILYTIDIYLRYLLYSFLYALVFVKLLCFICSLIFYMNICLPVYLHQSYRPFPDVPFDCIYSGPLSPAWVTWDSQSHSVLLSFNWYWRHY